jgi:hypothetical protein
MKRGTEQLVRCPQNCCVLMLSPSDWFDLSPRCREAVNSVRFQGRESDWIDRQSGYFTPRLSDDDSEVATSPMQPILSPSPSSLCGSPQQSIGQKCARRELDPADDVCVKPNGDLDELTPRCGMRQCIAEQKTLVQESCGNNVDWNLMASFLSPVPAKPPSHPSTKICLKSNIHSRPFRFGIPSAPKCRCLCIACVGLSHAKPDTSPCLVCGATILFSICQNKTSTSASPSSAPVMCFNCKVFMLAFDS